VNHEYPFVLDTRGIVQLVQVPTVLEETVTVWTTSGNLVRLAHADEIERDATAVDGGAPGSVPLIR